MKVIKKWSRLDNAAKIFPPTSSKRDPKVFRFVCELYEPVDAQILQSALDKTIVRFPFYKFILKKGLFWYYFEESTLQPIVREENEPPCAPIYNADQPGLLFRVCYYKNRINLEVFHALSDGMGAMHFLRTLVCFYLEERHSDSVDGDIQLNDCDSSPEQKRLDAFQKYYDKDKKIRKQQKNKKDRPYRVRGARLPDGRVGIIEGVLSFQSLLENAHNYDATISELLVALLLCSIREGMAVRDRANPLVITVPVDLRHFFPTKTARNFFGIIHVSHDFKKDGESFSDVLANVRRSFEEQLSPENMLEIINRYSALENKVLVKAIPLEIKIPCLKLAGWHADREDTAAISNLGRVTMPPELSAYIRLFDVVVSTKRPQICLCSFGDTLTISFSSPLESTDIPRCFFRRLAEMGIEIEIYSNLEQEQQEEEETDAM